MFKSVREDEAPIQALINSQYETLESTQTGFAFNNISLDKPQ